MATDLEPLNLSLTNPNIYPPNIPPIPKIIKILAEITSLSSNDSFSNIYEKNGTKAIWAVAGAIALFRNRPIIFNILESVSIENTRLNDSSDDITSSSYFSGNTGLGVNNRSTEAITVINVLRRNKI